MTQATSQNYWIASNALYIELNALGNPDYIQASCVSGAQILVYIKDVIGYDAGHNYQRWPLQAAPTVFNSHTAKYVYAAIPRPTIVPSSSAAGSTTVPDASPSGNALIVFPSEIIDIYGKNAAEEQIGSEDYYYINLGGIISSSGENGSTDREWQQRINTGYLSSDEALNAQVDSEWYNYSTVDQIVTFLKNLTMKVGTWFINLYAKALTIVSGGSITFENNGTITGVAELGDTPDGDTSLSSENHIVTPAYADKQWLSKKHSDKTEFGLEMASAKINGTLDVFGNTTLQSAVDIKGDLTAESKATFSDAVESLNFIRSMAAGQGWGTDAAGNLQVESIEVRSYMKVLELVFNRLSAEESDFMFTESGTIDSVSAIAGTNQYVLSMRKKTDTDFTAFHEQDVLKGVVNNLTNTGASVGTDYYTAWMKVVAVNTSNGKNEITVEVYGDNDTPANKNFPPAPLMVLHRWGNAIAPDAETAKLYSFILKKSETEYINTRQSCWYISSIEKRIVMLDGVHQPKLDPSGSNYAAFFGLPYELDNFKGYSIDPTQPYLYVRGAFLQDVHYIDYLGNPIRTERFRGVWSAETAAGDNPYVMTANTFDTVYHNNAKYQCVVDKATEEPGVSAQWSLLQKASEGVGIKNVIPYYKQNDTRPPIPSTEITHNIDFANATYQENGMPTQDGNGWGTGDFAQIRFQVSSNGSFTHYSQGTFNGLRNTSHGVRTLSIRPFATNRDITISGFCLNDGGIKIENAVIKSISENQLILTPADGGDILIAIPWSNDYKTAVIITSISMYKYNADAKITTVLSGENWYQSFPSNATSKVWMLICTEKTDGTYSLSSISECPHSGLSAYEIAKAGGFTGTKEEWLASLVGARGLSAYESYRETTDDNPPMSESEWIESLDGEPGLSAYDIYVNEGGDLSKEEWLASLQGKPGASIVDVNNYYVWADNGTTLPASVTWQKNQIPTKPEGKNYLWNYEENINNEGNVVSSSTPSCIGYFSKDGVGLVEILEYYKLSNSTTAPAVIPTLSADKKTVNANGWTLKDAPSTDQDNRYLWNAEIARYTDGTYQLCGIHLSGVEGENGENGDNGADGIQPNLFGYDTLFISHNGESVHTNSGMAVIVSLDNTGRQQVFWGMDKQHDNYPAGIYAMSFSIKSQYISGAENLTQTQKRYEVNAGGDNLNDWGEPLAGSYTESNIDENEIRHVKVKFQMIGEGKIYFVIQNAVPNAKMLVEVSELKIERAETVLGISTPFNGLAPDSILQGQNVLKGTAEWSDDWTVRDGVTVTPDAYQGQSSILYIGGTKFTSADSKHYTIAITKDLRGRLTPNTWYALSFWGRGKGYIHSYIRTSPEGEQYGNGAGFVYCSEEGADERKKKWGADYAHNLSPDWQKHTMVFRTASDTYSLNYIYLDFTVEGTQNFAGNTFQIAMPKLEEGEKPTAWQRAEIDRQGADGQSPRIVDDEWYIGDTPTGIKASPDEPAVVDIDDDGYWTIDGQRTDPPVKAKGSNGQAVYVANVFRRSSTALTTAPTGGTFSNPMQNMTSGWSDGVPSGSEPVYMSSRVFTSDGLAPQQSTWSKPCLMADTADIDLEYSAVATNPGNPTANASNWHNDATDNDIWMAVRKKVGGNWSSWQISKIKGENGADGIQANLYGYDCILWGGDGNHLHTKDGFVSFFENGKGWKQTVIEKSPSWEPGIYSLSAKVQVIPIANCPSTFSVAISVNNGDFIDGHSDLQGQPVGQWVEMKVKFSTNNAQANGMPFWFAVFNMNDNSQFLFWVKDFKIERSEDLVGLCSQFNGLAPDSILQGQNILEGTGDWSGDMEVREGVNIVENACQGLPAISYTGGTKTESATAKHYTIAKTADLRGRLKPSTWYSLSFWAKGNGNIQSYVRTSPEGDIYGNGAGVVYCGEEGPRDREKKYGAAFGHNITSEWQKHTLIFKTAAEPVFLNYIYIDFTVEAANNTSDKNYQIAMVKLEEGEKPTAWQRAEIDRQGADGQSPRIVDDEWYIGDTPTGIKASPDEPAVVDIDDDGYWTIDGQRTDPPVKAKGSNGQAVYVANVFRRSSTALTTAPTGGTFSNPMQNMTSGWSDGVPSGSEPVYMSSRVFTSDGLAPQQSTWSKPCLMADTADIDLEYSAVATNPGNPTANDSNWHNDATDNDIWMAVRKKVGGNWSTWQISKIKGEKGDPGADALSLSLSATTIVVPTTNGSVSSGAINRSITASMYKGTNPLTITSIQISNNKASNNSYSAPATVTGNSFTVTLGKGISWADAVLNLTVNATSEGKTISMTASVALVGSAQGQSVQGAQGESVTRITEQWQATTKNGAEGVAELQENGWSNTHIEPTPEYQYVWNRELVTFRNPLNNSERTETTDPHICCTFADGLESCDNYYLASAVKITDSSLLTKKNNLAEEMAKLGPDCRYLYNKEVTSYKNYRKNTTVLRLVTIVGEDGDDAIIVTPSEAIVNFLIDYDGYNNDNAVHNVTFDMYKGDTKLTVTAVESVNASSSGFNFRISGTTCIFTSDGGSEIFIPEIYRIRVTGKDADDNSYSRECSITVSGSQKGAPGQKGDRGPSLAGPSIWKTGVAYKNGTNGQPQHLVIVEGETGSMYLCGYSHTSAAKTKPSANTSVTTGNTTADKPWIRTTFTEFMATKVLFAQKSIIENLALNSATAYERKADGSLDTTSPTVEIDGNTGILHAMGAEIEGSIKAKNFSQVLTECYVLDYYTSAHVQNFVEWDAFDNYYIHDISLDDHSGGSYYSAYAINTISKTNRSHTRYWFVLPCPDASMEGKVFEFTAPNFVNQGTAGSSSIYNQSIGITSWSKDPTTGAKTLVSAVQASGDNYYQDGAFVTLWGQFSTQVQQAYTAAVLCARRYVTDQNNGTNATLRVVCVARKVSNKTYYQWAILSSQNVLFVNSEIGNTIDT